MTDTQTVHILYLIYLYTTTFGSSNDLSDRGLRSEVKKNEQMVIYRKLLQTQTSYLVPMYNKICDI